MRFAAAESGAFIAKNCDIKAIDTKIVQIYVSLLGDPEAEVRSEAASKLVNLTEVCSNGLILSKILPSLKA